VIDDDEPPPSPEDLAAPRERREQPARVLHVTPAEYHDLVGFSASLAQLVRVSPLRAADAVERKIEQLAAQVDPDADDPGEDISDEKQKNLDKGSILHALTLGRGKAIEVIPTAKLAKNGAYSTAESKALRDGARRAGKVPVKEHDMPRWTKLGETIRARLADAGHPLEGGIAELAIAWTEGTPYGPVECKAMLDYTRFFDADRCLIPLAISDIDRASAIGVARASARFATIYDPKMGQAEPRRVMRNVDAFGHEIQAAAYLRGLAAVFPQLEGRIDFRFLFCETRRPFDVWTPPLSGVFLAVGEREWRQARNDWAKAREENHHPGFNEIGPKELTFSSWRLRQEGYDPDDGT
jgi:hypothetical protein